MSCSLFLRFSIDSFKTPNYDIRDWVLYGNSLKMGSFGKTALSDLKSAIRYQKPARQNRPGILVAGGFIFNLEILIFNRDI